MREIFAVEGIDVVYEAIPWSRAMMEVREGRMQGLIGAGLSETQGFVVPEEEIGLATMVFISRKDETWRYAGEASLRQARLAVVQDYSYGDHVDAHITAHGGDPGWVIVTAGDEPLRKNIELLQTGRVNVIIANRDVFSYHLPLWGLDPGDFIETGVAVRARLYIALSPGNPRSPHYRTLVDGGMPKLRASGKLDEIMARYGLTDWK